MNPHDVDCQTRVKAKIHVHRDGSFNADPWRNHH